MPSEIKQLRPAHVPTANANGRARGPEMASANSIHNRNSEPSTPTGDTVTVTGEAARLQELEQSLSTTPVVDSQKVEQLKQAIADGSYQLNPESIAEKMIDLEEGLS